MSRVFFKKDFKVFTPKPVQTESKDQTIKKQPNPKTQQPKVQIKVIHSIESMFGITNYNSEQDSEAYVSANNKLVVSGRKEFHPQNSLPIIQEAPIQQPQIKEKENDSRDNSSGKHISKDKSKASRKKKKAVDRPKKIKKVERQGNMVRLDLKRKYGEKFVGGLAANKRKFTRNGRLKDKYKKTGLSSQLQINGQGIYNSFVHSLSSALTITIALDNQQLVQKPVIDCKQYGRSREQLKQLINKVFGYQDFRFGQYQTTLNILQNKSTLFISQTGSGKSLTYILASLLCDGIAVVISPLISLMLDQVEKLPKQLPGVCIHSHLTIDQKHRIVKLIQDGKVKLIYMTPEALETDLAYKMRTFPPISFVCIDQAHCISELSHNFRTSYLSMHQLIKSNFKFEKEYCALALTASANQETATSIMKKLQIKQYIRSSTLQRSNLVLTVSKDSGQKKYAALLKYIRSEPIRKLRGILIYCRTYAKVKEVCNYLKSSGISCAIFFGQLTQQQKTTIIHKFREGEIKVIASTIALGMGLDFANLDSVIHLCMPSSVQNYVQEIGRAGRRGFTAYCHMFLDQEDYLKQRGCILSDKNDQEDLQELFKAIKECTFQKMESKPTTLKRLLEQESDEEKSCNEDEYKGRICYVNSKELSENLDIKQESIITILLKIEQISNGKIIKVLAPSYQAIEIAFFKNNQKILREQSQIFRIITKNCRQHHGKIFVRLIDICNKLNRIPSDLLGEIQSIADQYFLHIEKKNTVFVWQYRGQMTFQEFKTMFRKQLVAQMKAIQELRLLKLNILYTMGYLNSYFDMTKLIEHEVVKKEHKYEIQSLLDKYFSSPPSTFYAQLTQGEHYLPIYHLQPSQMTTLSNLSKRFLHHQGVDDKKSMQKYMNGKIITNILLGISTPGFHQKKYGQEPYFGEFKNMQYKQMIVHVREACQEYLEDITNP